MPERSATTGGWAGVVELRSKAEVTVVQMRDDEDSGEDDDDELATSRGRETE